MRRAVLLVCVAALASFGCRRGRNQPSPSSSASGGASRAERPARPGPPGPAHRLLASARARGTTLVVWRDRGIRAARLDGTGTLLDDRPIAVSSDAKDGDPTVAGYDGGFWVVWEHFRKGPGVNVQGARVALDGRLLDPSPRELTGPDATQRSPRIACGPKRCLLAFHEYREASHGTLHTRGIDLGGSLGAVEAHPGKSHQDGDLARAGDGFLSVFTGGLDPKLDTVSALRLGGAVQAIHETRFNSGTRVACGPTGCYVAWLHGEEVVGGPRHRDIDGARVYVTPTRSQIWGCSLEADGRIRAGASPRRLRDLDTGLSRLELLALAAGERDFFLSWEATAFEPDGRSSAGVLRIGADGATDELSPPEAANRAVPGEGWPVVLLRGDRLVAARGTAGGAVDWAVRALPK